MDSDDDLEPMGEFEDRVRPKERAPAYVGACLRGLMDEENPERVECCLRDASTLIRRSGSMTREVRSISGYVIPWRWPVLETLTKLLELPSHF